MTNHILQWTHIVDEAWSSYNFLEEDYYAYTHETHTYSRGDFVMGINRTTESFWNEIKWSIKFGYKIIKRKNLFYF